MAVNLDSQAGTPHPAAHELRQADSASENSENLHSYLQKFVSVLSSEAPSISESSARGAVAVNEATLRIPSLRWHGGSLEASNFIGHAKTMKVRCRVMCSFTSRLEHREARSVATPTLRLTAVSTLASSFAIGVGCDMMTISDQSA